MLNFKEEFGSIVDVDNVSLFCFGYDDEITPKNLIVAGGGSKFSSLCGFRFISKVNPTYNHGEFRLVFCTKLRSKIYRQANQNPSQWFAFLHVGRQHEEVLDKEFCKIAFDFDVDKFFETDFFAKTVERFKKIVTKGVQNATEMVKQYATSSGNIPGTYDDYNSLPRYLKAIQESIPLISSTRFNDKKYTLKMQFDDPKVKYGKNKIDIERFSQFLKKNQDDTKVKKYLKNNPADD